LGGKTQVPPAIGKKKEKKNWRGCLEIRSTKAKLAEGKGKTFRKKREKGTEQGLVKKVFQKNHKKKIEHFEPGRGPRKWNVGFSRSGWALE